MTAPHADGVDLRVDDIQTRLRAASAVAAGARDLEDTVSAWRASLAHLRASAGGGGASKQSFDASERVLDLNYEFLNAADDVLKRVGAAVDVRGDHERQAAKMAELEAKASFFLFFFFDFDVDFDILLYC